MTHNIYLPRIAKIISIKDQTSGPRAIKTFRVELLDGEPFDFRPGQCCMLSVFGKGEIMISIASPHLSSDSFHRNAVHLTFSVMLSGRVTTALHDLHVGDSIGVRGPLGGSFPFEEWEGKNLVFIAGGIGIAPIWGLLHDALHQHELHDEISVIYGARSSDDLVYHNQMLELRRKIPVHLSIDNEEEGWKGYTGFVPSNLMEVKPSPENTIAITCGPPIMIKFVIQNLEKLGFTDDQIYTTIENKMKCGVGKCGRCNVGKDYACTKGPVYSWAELKKLPQDY